MDVPQFPAPPILGVVVTPTIRSRLSRNADISRSFTLGISGNKRNSDMAEKYRPRSASCIVARRRHIRRKNLVHPRHQSHRDYQRKNAPHRITELNIKMIHRNETCQEPTIAVKDDVCNDKNHCTSNDIEHSYGTETFPTPISDETHLTQNKDINYQVPTPRLQSTGVQTLHGVLYRLRILPLLKDIVDEEERSTNPTKSSRILRYLRFLGRCALCQFGLLWLLVFWAIIGAFSFYATEGPRERQQVIELKDMQRDLAVGLATELRQLKANSEEEMEPLWSNKVRQYVAKHEKFLLIAVSTGYGEASDGGELWTFAGCILFSISLLTTLGFGAPVPRTTAGRVVTVIFAAIGIPAHFMLILNFGLLLALGLQRHAIRRKMSPTECREIELAHPLPMPLWVKALPFFCIGLYYLLGILCFGVARLRPFAAALLFPLDFTAAGGLATTSGCVRILYGFYLEGAVTVTAFAVAILKVSATQSLTNIGLKYGLLTVA